MIWYVTPGFRFVSVCWIVGSLPAAPLLFRTYVWFVTVLIRKNGNVPVNSNVKNRMLLRQPPLPSMLKVLNPPAVPLSGTKSSKSPLVAMSVPSCSNTLSKLVST